MAGVTALYLRISVDDEKQDESDSVVNQRGLLRAYAAADPSLCGGEILEFADDGWSGTNFNRPKVQELLELARRGGVQSIVVKDLSRWGRNYPEVNEYLDQIFPFLGVRFISVNDHYDSRDYAGSTAPIDVAFNSIIHDVYSKELSVKVRQSYMAKAKKGEYVCGLPPFGYVRSETQKNQLIIDEGAAVIVRRIFGMAAGGGMTCAGIAAALNAEGVETALMRRRWNGQAEADRQTDDERTFWSVTQVNRIIRDERYTGNMACFKYRRQAVGSRRQARQPESEWLRVPGTHEAIVSDEIFAEANARIRNNKKSKHGAASDRSPFTGKIFCGHCGLAMRRQNTKQPYHYCDGEKLKKGKGCYAGKVFNDHIKEIVLAAVKAEAQKAYDANQKRKRAGRRDSADRDAIISERKRFVSQIALLERRGDRLYEDYADGKLDKDGYLAAKAAHAAELSNSEARVAELSARLDGISENPEITDNEPLLRRIMGAEEITDEVLSLVERIVVYDPARIEIRFAFGDTNTVEGLGYGA